MENAEGIMARRHRPRDQEDEILHDFDAKERSLKLLFVDRKGGLTQVTYRLCPECGVTMDEMEEAGRGRVWTCSICGRVVREA